MTMKVKKMEKVCRTASLLQASSVIFCSPRTGFPYKATKVSSEGSQTVRTKNSPTDRYTNDKRSLSRAAEAERGGSEESSQTQARSRSPPPANVRSGLRAFRVYHIDHELFSALRGTTIMMEPNRPRQVYVQDLAWSRFPIPTRIMILMELICECLSR
jgi:hypothetical protein